MEEKTLKVSLETARRWYKTNEMHKEYYIGFDSIFYIANSNYRDVNSCRNRLVTKEDAEAHLALMQLHRLRDVYRQGWIPDWKDDSKLKYCVVLPYEESENYTTRCKKLSSFV